MAVAKLRPRAGPLQHLLSAAALLMLLGGAVPAHAASLDVRGQTEDEAPFVPGEVLVRFEADADGKKSAAIEEVDGEVRERLALPRARIVDLGGGTPVDEAADALTDAPGVSYAEPNYLQTVTPVPDDFYFELQWALENTGQLTGPVPVAGTSDSDIDAPEAWNATTGSTAVEVAVIDSGADFNHPDLVGNLSPGGYDFLSGDADPSDPGLYAGAGHGTQTMGVIGASGNNEIGVSGVAWDVELLPLRACTSTCSVSAITNAIGYAAARGAHIVNGSFGGPTFSRIQQDAIDAAENVLFVFAAGNEALNNDVSPSFPCNSASPNVICVAATDQRDQLARFSNYGRVSVDLAAPGVGIATTSLAGSYVYVDGTSFAAPQVAGAAALILADAPGDSSAEVRSRILSTVDRSPALSRLVATGGRLNVGNALSRAPAAPPGPTPSEPPPSPEEFGSVGPVLPDTTPPETHLTKRPPRRTARSRARFAFESSELSSTFRCRLDHRRFAPCSSPHKTDVRPGQHKFAVRAIDASGNQDQSAASRTFRVVRR